MQLGIREAILAASRAGDASESAAPRHAHPAALGGRHTHLSAVAGDAKAAGRAVAEAAAAGADVAAVVHALVLPPVFARPRLRAVLPLPCDI